LPEIQKHGSLKSCVCHIYRLELKVSEIMDIVLAKKIAYIKQFKCDREQ